MRADAGRPDAGDGLDAGPPDAGTEPTECPPGSMRQGIGFGERCPAPATCFEHGDLYCAMVFFSEEACEQAGGSAVHGPLDEIRCAEGESVVGVLSVPLDGFCCDDIRPCAPQGLEGTAPCDDGGGRRLRRHSAFVWRRPRRSLRSR